eukprot:1054831-Rhodomonas_salina.3
MQDTASACSCKAQLTWGWGMVSSWGVTVEEVRVWGQQGLKRLLLHTGSAAESWLSASHPSPASQCQIGVSRVGGKAAEAVGGGTLQATTSWLAGSRSPLLLPLHGGGESLGAARAEEAAAAHRFRSRILAVSCLSVTCVPLPTPDWLEQCGRLGSRSCGGGHLASNHLTASWVTHSSAASAAHSLFACANPVLCEHNH